MTPKGGPAERNPLMGTLARVGDLGMRVAVVLLAGTFGGRWLDQHLGWTPWMTLAGAALGFGGAMSWLVIQVRALQQDEEKDGERE